jgi:hypothetical protein
VSAGIAFAAALVAVTTVRARPHVEHSPLAEVVA